MANVQVEFEDNSIAVKNALEQACIAYLHEAGGELEAQVKRNTRVDTGQTKGSWSYKVDEDKLVATVGNPLENAIWEEFGTGEYALNGNGRKGGWAYEDKKGEWQFTRGKRPNRALQSAFTTLKNPLKKRAEQVLKARLQDD